MRHQRTIKEQAIFKGKGIHTGREVTIKISQASENRGLVFIRSDIEGNPAISADISNLYSGSGSLRCTFLKKDNAGVKTTEHLMAALSGLSIDNAIIEIDSEELPAMDGSSLDYANSLNEAGVIEQDSLKREFILKEIVSVKNDNSIIIAAPNEHFKITYILNIPQGDMDQCAEFSYKSPDGKRELFLRNIAPARTFCSESEVAEIQKMGLGKGGDYKNTLVIKNGRPIKNDYRVPNELSSHKILDMLGDLALLNSDIKAHFIAVKSGHMMNAVLLRRLNELS